MGDNVEFSIFRKNLQRLRHLHFGGFGEYPEILDMLPSGLLKKPLTQRNFESAVQINMSIYLWGYGSDGK